MKIDSYNISYFYLVAIKKEAIEPGMPITTFISQAPKYASQPEAVNKLLDEFSSETKRFEIQLPSPQLDDNQPV